LIYTVNLGCRTFQRTLLYLPLRHRRYAVMLFCYSDLVRVYGNRREGKGLASVYYGLTALI